MERGMTGEKVFCTQCGAEMGAEDTFCPSCGARADGTSRPYRSTNTRYEDSDLDTTRILTLIYGILALALGVLALVGSTMMNSPEMKQMFIDYGLNYDLDSLAATAAIQSVIIIASGACALVSSYLINKRTNGSIALVLCIVASVTSLIFGFPFGLVTVAVGIYVSYRIYRSQNLLN